MMYLLPLAKNMDSNIIGIDISEEMISFACKKYSHEKIKFLCGDIMSNDFYLEESSFDQIISFYVLHFIKDYKEALSRLYRILKPGGQCGLIISLEDNLFHSYKLLGNDPKWSKYMEGYEKFYPDWVEEMENPNEVGKTRIDKAAKEVGFNVIESSIKDMSDTWESLNMYTEFILTLSTFLNKIPKDMYKDWHSSLRSHLCKRYNIPDTEEFHKKPYRENHHALSVILEKSFN